MDRHVDTFESREAPRRVHEAAGAMDFPRDLQDLFDDTRVQIRPAGEQA